MDNIPGDLNTQQKDVATTLRDEEKVASEAHNGTDSATVCSDAYTVQSDADTVQSDEYTIESDGYTQDSDRTTVGNALHQLQADWSSLRQAEAAVPGYTSGDSPGKTAVSNAVVADDNELNQSQQTFAGYLASAKQAVQTAQGYADAAQKICDGMP